MISFEEVVKKNNSQLDENQLKAVFCDQNCVVSAGAGSGKTTVLSYRFLRLVLEEKANCDQILTLTFTRKAAREMRERIHRQLLTFSDDPKIALQLAKFPDANIATLDSFCSTILRCDSISYGIASDFVIDDEQNKRNAIRCANALMEERSFKAGAKILAELYTPDNLVENMLVSLVSQHYYLPRKVDENLSEKLIDIVREQYYDLLVSFTSLLERYATFGDAPKTLLSVGAIARTLLDEFGKGLGEQEMFDLLAGNDFFFRKPGKGNGEEFEFLRETTEEYKALRRKLCVALSVLLHKDQLASVIDFVREYVQAYQQEKRKTGSLSFSDVSSLAVEILKNNLELRSYFKTKFRYIMIDEFQDNNEQQKELLYLLAEREEIASEGIPLPSSLKADKLFFVGDEKQSIYRFRGADVRVFKHLDEELVKAGGKALSLDTNYRSEPALIELFNRMFSVVMRNEGEPFEADFTSLGYRKPTEGIEPTCTLLVKPLKESADNEPEKENQEKDEEEENAASADAEAEAVAKLMVRMLTTDEYLIPSNDGPRRPKPSDMALLMRSTSNQLSFEKTFRKYSIPYTLQAARSLMLEAPANDLYAMLQLTLYPSDKLSYMSALRSPFCNISDEGVYASLTYYSSTSQARPFTEGPSLDDEDTIRYQGCCSFFSQLCKKVETGKLSEIVQFMWYESGYYLSLASKPEYQMYLEHFTFLHRLAQMKEEQGMSLSQFLDFMRVNLGQNERLDDLEVLKEQGEGVQIMTVHKSKGLEFPIVFLGNSGSVGRKGFSNSITPFGEEMLPSFMSSSYHISQTKTEEARNAALLFSDEDEKLFELAELKRLLYVALTRAETHLVISGYFTKSNRNVKRENPDSNHLLMCCHTLGIDIDNPFLQDGIVRSYEIGDIEERSLYSTISDARSKHMTEAARWYASPAKKADIRPIRYAVTSLYGEEQRDGEDAFGEMLPQFATDGVLEEVKQQTFSVSADFGTFVHGLCEAMVLKKQIEDEFSYMSQRLYHLLTIRQRRVLLSDALLFCNNFLKSDIYKQYVEPNDTRCEVKFFSSLVHEDRQIVVEGSIDLLVKTDTEILIIDFKTDRYRMPEKHKGQLDLYMQAARRIYGKPVRSCVTYLRSCGAEEWWYLDDA